MPGFNQTGPSGRGPMTGRGRGPCHTGRPVSETGFSGGVGFGRGMGFGRGFRCSPGPQMRGNQRTGLGRNRWRFNELTAEDAPLEIDRLKRQATFMKHALETINQQLSELEKKE